MTYRGIRIHQTDHGGVYWWDDEKEVGDIAHTIEEAKRQIDRVMGDP